MSAFSDYSENAIINHFFRGSGASVPTSSYVALFTADPSDANTTANEVQVANWPAYVRQDAASGAAISTGWSAPANGVSSNAKTLTYPSNNGSGTVTVTHVGLYDASSGGNLIMHSALSSSKALSVSDVLSFAIGSLILTVQ